MSSNAGHAAKLAQFEKQLRDVEYLLTADPTNVEYQNLKNDLLEVISLTKDLVQVQPAVAVNTTVPASKKSKVEEQPPTQLKKSTHEVPDSITIFETGTIVEAKYNNQVWYPVYVIEYDSATDEYQVQFLTFDQEKRIPGKQLRPLSGILEDHVSKDLPLGTAVAARYSVDRIMYNAKIERVTPKGYVVVFTDYGNTEEVPLQWVTSDISVVGSHGDDAQLADPNDTGAAPPLVKNFAASKAKKRKNVYALRKAEMQAQLQVIPESLRVRPEDTEAQKKKKKRIANRLKKKNRVVKIGIAQNERAYSWQKFSMKTKKKGAKG